MKSINAHLGMAGNASEAIGLYKELFGGTSVVHLVGDRPETGLPADAVFHSDLRGDAYRLMVADLGPSSPLIVSLHVQCDDGRELQRYYEVLAAGGNVHCGLGKAFGGLYAKVTDRFGVTWHLTSPGSTPL